MSSESVELVRKAIAAWNAGDVDDWLEFFTPDIEVVFPADVPEPGPFHGRDELRAWAEGFMGAWEDYQAEIRQAVPAGEQVVIALYQRAHGRDAGIEIEQTDWHVFSIPTARSLAGATTGPKQRPSKPQGCGGRAAKHLLLADSHTYVCRTWDDLAARLVWARDQGYACAKARLANGYVDRPPLPLEQARLIEHARRLALN